MRHLRGAAHSTTACVCITCPGSVGRRASLAKLSPIGRDQLTKAANKCSQTASTPNSNQPQRHFSAFRRPLGLLRSHLVVKFRHPARNVYRRQSLDAAATAAVADDDADVAGFPLKGHFLRERGNRGGPIAITGIMIHISACEGSPKKL